MIVFIKSIAPVTFFGVGDVIYSITYKNGKINSGDEYMSLFVHVGGR
jgi:hypothetical protein